MTTKLSAWVIEDDMLSGDIFALSLREAHYEPTIIRDGIEALERLKTGAPNLVVLDIHLPGISGISLLEYIRSSSHLAGTRVLVLTADPAMVELIGDKAELALIKPVGFNQLRDLANRIAIEIQGEDKS
jgi:DNA-binding response OmpR family regulator